VYVVLCLLVLVVSSSAIDCLERLLSKMTYTVSSGTLNPTQLNSTTTTLSRDKQYMS